VSDLIFEGSKPSRDEDELTVAMIEGSHELSEEVDEIIFEGPGSQIAAELVF
jgi:hypothetical protein